jgi:tRNA-Thr(GGU) m(6)t(6)A37 methyltransferase TsaA
MIMKITFKPIGVVHSPFKELKNMPIQPTGCKGVEGEIEIFPEFSPGLQDLDGFSHIFVIYFLHKVQGWKSKVIPFLDTQERGIFSTRSPVRPNPIGLSVLEIKAVNGNRIMVNNTDILDGTPVLDIKPFVPQFDQPENTRIGWLTGNVIRVKDKKSDDRFLSQ